MDHKKQNFLVRHVPMLKLGEVLPRTLEASKSIGALILTPFNYEDSS